MFLDDDDIKAIRETFQYMDQDNGGDISTEELKEAYGLLNSKSWQSVLQSDECFAKNPSDSSIQTIEFHKNSYKPLSDDKINIILEKVD